MRYLIVSIPDHCLLTYVNPLCHRLHMAFRVGGTLNTNTHIHILKASNETVGCSRNFHLRLL